MKNENTSKDFSLFIFYRMTEIDKNLCFDNHNFLNFITLTDGIDHFQSFINFTKAGMLTIQMFCITSAMTDKEL